MSKSPSSIDQAIAALKNNELLILLDDAEPQPVAYIVGGAANISIQDICLMVNEGRSVICAALSEDRIQNLGLALSPSTPHQNSIEFAASVDARQDISTGISAADRARTLQTLAATSNPKLDLVTPGHIFPMKAKDGGVLVRNAVAEATVDLLRIAQLPEVSAFCHCLDHSGNLITAEQAVALADKCNLKLIKISDIIRKRLATEKVIEKVAEAKLPTAQAGMFSAIVFRSLIDNAEHLALVKGDVTAARDNSILVRVQPENKLEDLLAPGNINSRALIIGALKEIEKVGTGIFVYIRHPRQGSLSEQVKYYASGSKTLNLSRQLREYGIGSQILKALGATKISLLTRSGFVPEGLSPFGIEVTETKAFEPHSAQEIVGLEQLLTASFKSHASKKRVMGAT